MARDVDGVTKNVVDVVDAEVHLGEDEVQHAAERAGRARGPHWGSEPAVLAHARDGVGRVVLVGVAERDMIEPTRQINAAEVLGAGVANPQEGVLDRRDAVPVGPGRRVQPPEVQDDPQAPLRFRDREDGVVVGGLPFPDDSHLDPC